MKKGLIIANLIEELMDARIERSQIAKTLGGGNELKLNENQIFCEGLKKQIGKALE